MTKEEKLKRKIYRKANKKAKKELIDIVKHHYGPWDNFLSNFFLVQVDHWIAYYSNGYNVWAMENRDAYNSKDPLAPESWKDRPTRLEIALELKRLYEEYADFLHRHFKDENLYGADGKVDYEKFNAAYKKAKEDFFNYYAEYADDMWD